MSAESDTAELPAEQPPQQSSTADTGDKRKESPAKTKAPTRKRKKTTQNLQEFYNVHDFQSLFQPPPQQLFDDAQKALEELLAKYDITQEDLLALPANVANQRLAEKWFGLQEKFKDVLESASTAAERLVTTARVHKVQREAQLLKAQLAAETAKNKAS